MVGGYRVVIVIATHNGFDFIDNHLRSWNEHGTDGHRILVVATGASSLEYLTHLFYLTERQWNFPLFVTTTPYAGYDTGAYLWGLKYFSDEEEFFFCHDSMLVKRPGVMNEFKKVATQTTAGCIPWLVFRLNSYEDEDQWNYVSQFLEDPSIHPHPGFGIFGPIFYTTKEALQRLPEKLFRYHPENKNQQESMERGWSAAFHRSGVLTLPLEGDFYEVLALADRYSWFQKFLPKRQ